MTCSIPSLSSPTLSRRGALLSLGGAAMAGSIMGFTGCARKAHDWTLGWSNAARRNFATANVRRVSGKLPEGFSGTLYRNGPGLFTRGSDTVGHWFDGDGLVGAWHIGSGKVRHTARFVETHKYVTEDKLGRFVYGGLDTAGEPGYPLTGPDDINAANTSVLPVGDEVWALWEAGSAHALDGVTLETKGPKTLRRDMKGMPFSAHPKVDIKNHIWNFGQDYFGGNLVIYHLSPKGELISADLVPGVPPTMIHDWTITDRYLIFVAPSVRAQMNGGDTPLSNFTWHADLAQRVIVLDKDDLTQRREYELPPGFQFHYGGAWETKGGDIQFTACVGDDAEFLLNGAGAILHGEDLDSAPAKLQHVVLEAGGKARIIHTEHAFATHEFPQFDPRLVGQKSSYLYTVGGNRKTGPGQSRLIRHDLSGGEMVSFDYGEHQIIEEHLFVPRGSGETEGWMVGTTLNLKTGKTRLNILDAGNIAAGPVAVFELDYAIPLGFHGAWA